MNPEHQPDAQRRGWLKNDNLPGDFLSASRCGARTRKKTTCQAPAMKNGRCRMHGGSSTGPRTPEGLERSQHANWKHGAYSRDERDRRRRTRQLLRDCRALFAQLDESRS